MPYAFCVMRRGWKQENESENGCCREHASYISFFTNESYICKLNFPCLSLIWMKFYGRKSIRKWDATIHKIICIRNFCQRTAFACLLANDCYFFCGQLWFWRVPILTWTRSYFGVRNSGDWCPLRDCYSWLLLWFALAPFTDKSEFKVTSHFKRINPTVFRNVMKPATHDFA